MTNNVLHIHVQWDGPHTFEAASQLTDKFTDYGVYQIYGSHPVYGSDVLIYIGKAERQTFGVRLKQEAWHYFNQDSSRIAYYVGRLSGYEDISVEEHASQTSLVERTLIQAHWPAGNSSGLNVKFGKDLHDVHVLNWGRYRDLLPEVSGARYSDLFYSGEGYSSYGESGRQGTST